MSKLFDIATATEGLSSKLEKAYHTLDIAMEHLWEERPKEDDIVSVSAFINRFESFYTLLEISRDITSDSIKEAQETACKLYELHRKNYTGA